MAICKNCGARYGDQENRCPYCGAFDTDEEKKIIREEVRRYEKEKEDIKAIPGRRLKKRTKLAVIFIGVFLTGFALWAAAATVLGNLERRREQAREEKESEIMENYYREGQYGELYDFYMEKESYSPSDDKYREVASAWNWMEFMRETQEALSESGDGYYGISYALSGDVQALEIIEEGLSDGIERGNEEILRDFQEEILGFFREDLEMSEEEIRSVRKMEDREDFDTMEMQIMERLHIR